jgi:hypothetical protein
MKMLTFLLKNTDRLVSRMLLNALLFGALAAGVTLLVGAEGTRQWPPQQLSYIATAIIAGFAAYAAAVSILLGAALHGLVRASAPAPQVAPAKPIAPATSTVAAPEQRAVPTS